MKLIVIKEFRVSKIDNEIRNCTGLSKALPPNLRCTWSAMVQKLHMIKFIIAIFHRIAEWSVIIRPNWSNLETFINTFFFYQAKSFEKDLWKLRENISVTISYYIIILILLGNGRRAFILPREHVNCKKYWCEKTNWLLNKAVYWKFRSLESKTFPFLVSR